MRNRFTNGMIIITWYDEARTSGKRGRVGLVAAGIGDKFPGIGRIDGLLNNAADEAVVESCDNNTETASIS